MIIYRGIEKKIKPRRRAAAIGVFDGVHRGHVKILKRMLSEARKRRLVPAVITFDPHPNKVLNPGAKHPILMSLEHRLRLFKKLGAAETLVVPFNKKTASIPREIFLKKYLIGRFGVKSLTIGHDFRFGRRALGGENYLRTESGKLGFHLSAVSALKNGREIISSTRIRRLIERGAFKKAERMLGRPVSVYGTVIRGKGRGRRLGFPTANLDPHHETLPPAGVYAAYGFLDNRRLKGVLHIGARPTFGDEKSLEVHFLNFHKNLYGRELELIFLKRLRPIRKFKGAEELRKAIQGDIRKASFCFTRPVKSSII